MREDVVEGPRVEAGVTREDAGAGQHLVGRRIPRRARQRRLTPAPGATAMPAVVLGPPDQLGQLSHLAGHALADLATRGAVDQDEEGGAGYLVVEPGSGRHHDRHTA